MSPCPPPEEAVVSEVETQIHATCVALRRGERWAGVLLAGPSGAGKSDLALRLIDRGARLIADDRTTLRRHGGLLLASAPAAIAGLVEARGVGILRLPHDRLLPEAEVAAMVELRPAGPEDRIPDPGTVDLLGIAVRRLVLPADAPATPAKIRLAVGDGAAQ